MPKRHPRGSKPVTARYNLSKEAKDSIKAISKHHEITQSLLLDRFIKEALIESLPDILKSIDRAK